MALDEGEIWENARKYVELIGKIPQSFTYTVRVLKSNHLKNIEEGKLGYNPDSIFQLGRVLKSKTVLAPFYFATKALFPDKEHDEKNITGAQIMEFFSPTQAANILTTIFYHRRLKKLCAPEPFVWLEKKIQDYMDMGVLLGQHIPSVGITDALIVSSLRHLALGLFILRDNKSFQAYKLHLKKAKKQFDVEQEIKLFGSSHIHVGSLMLQLMGFGVEYATSYSMALLSTPRDKLPSEPSRIRLISLYIEALYSGGEPPAVVDEADYDIKVSNIDKVVDAADNIRTDGSVLPWVLMTKENLSSNTTPKLLAEAQDGDDTDADI